MKVHVESIKFGYPTKRDVLNDISFSADDGEVIAVLGASG